MQELRELLQGGPGDPGLDLAVLQIATIEYPELVPESFLEILDSYARELGERLNPPPTAKSSFTPRTSTCSKSSASREISRSTITRPIAA